MSIKEKIEKAAVVIKDGGQKVGSLASEAKNQVVDAANNAKDSYEMKVFCPITYDEYQANKFVLPRMVRITGTNEHNNSSVCKDAIIYNPEIAKMKILEVPRQNIGLLKEKFIPNADGIIYLRNPYVQDSYIDIQYYFDYLKDQRRSELEMIANKLGAKHISIETAERKSEFVSVKGKKGMSAKASEDAKAEAGVSAESQFKGYSIRECNSDLYFVGGEPEEPELVYYKHDNDINNLVKMRMGINPITKKTFKLEFSTSYDLSISVASTIDAVLKKLSLAGEDSISGQVIRDKKTCFKYVIEF